MDWLNLNCSFCAAKFKIKLAHAHLKGRCPVCGYRIKPPRPDLYEYKALSVSDAHEPSGLVAEDEEWPEPAIVVVEEHAGGEYRMSTASPAQTPTRPDPPGSKDVFGLGPQYERVRQQPVLDAVPVEPPLKFVPDGPPAASGPAKSAAAKSAPKTAPAVPLDPIMDDVPASVAQIKPAPTPESPKPEASGGPAQSPDPLFDDLLIPAAPRPVAKPAPPAAAESKGPRFAQVPPEPADDVPVAQEAPPKPEPIVGLYGFMDAPAGTAGITAPVSEFAHVHPSPQVAPLAEPPKPRPVLEAKLAPPDPAANAALPPTEETKPAAREELYQYRLSQAETKPYRPPKPPDNPLWTGVWNFAWQATSIKMCVWLSIGFTAFLLALGIAAIFIRMINEGAATIVAGIGLVCVILGGIWITLWTGSYASACTLKIVEETANGEQDIPGPDGAWKEWFWCFLRVGFVIFCGVAACGLFGLCLPASAATVIFMALWPAVFNTFFLSILAGDSFWALIHGPTIEKMGGKLSVTLKMYVWTFGLLGIVLGSGWLVIDSSPWFALFCGSLTAICCLTYARVMGRVGLLLMTDDSKGKKKRKKKRKKVASLPAAAQEPDAPEMADEGGEQRV